MVVVMLGVVSALLIKWLSAVRTMRDEYIRWLIVVPVFAWFLVVSGVCIAQTSHQQTSHQQTSQQQTSQQQASQQQTSHQQTSQQQTSQQQTSQQQTSQQLAPQTVPLCTSCHAKQFQAWQSSSHAWSMRTADVTTVIGNFDKQVYRGEGLEAEFIHNDQGFFVRLKEDGGDVVSWRVDYTFGVYPLQQYLIQTGDGRLQALNIAWDNRPKKQGGQRWFRLDKTSHPVKGEALHWQGVYQNWNSQCASCHSTDLIKNYDPQTRHYSTRWSEANVACEACHGNADAHLDKVNRGGPPAAADFVRKIDAVGIWLKHMNQDTAVNASLESTGQLEACMGCHSLRTQLAEGLGSVTTQADKFTLERLKEPLYFPDGQVREEVFVYGSFLQSKMHNKGVVCSNCHEPHSLKLKFSGNLLCTQCHKAEKFDTQQHHYHPEEVDSKCVDCHMPERTFMVIDGRRDHSFRIPRPDLSKMYGSPDVCTGCHSDRNLDWAVNAIAQWFPERRHKRHWSEWRTENDIELLISFLADPSQPALVRSTLMEFRGEQLASQYPAAIDKLMSDKEPLIRESAYRIARYMPDQERSSVWQGVADEVRAVRLAAYESAMLTGLIPEKATAEQEKQINNQVTQEYQQFLSLQSDTPAGLALNGRYWRALGQTERAEKNFVEALSLDQDYLPALLELVDLYRQSARIKEALVLLESSVERTPEIALLHHLLGLVRLKELNYDDALKALADAARLEPQNLLYGYRYAVVLNELGKSREATNEVNRLLQIYPDQETVRRLLMIIERSQRASEGRNSH